MIITSNDHPYRVTAVEGSAPYANNHPIKVAIDGGIVTPAEFEELEKKVDALATDLSYKGGVEDYDHLPQDPEEGDVYTTEDTGILWVWDGIKWVALNDSKKAITGSTDPTTSTEGELGQLYLNTTTGKVYILQTIDTSTTPATYTWIAVGPTVVQTTGTSTTDVMSQNAVTSTIFADNTYDKIKIGGDTSLTGYRGVVIGGRARASGTNSIAIGSAIAAYETRADANYAIGIGFDARATGVGGVSIGAGSRATQRGQFDIGSIDTSYGYNSSNYRLLSGLYDGQSAHDAATVGQIGSTISDQDFATLLNGTGA